MDKFSEEKEWGNWLDNEIVKHSGKPFKSGLKIGIAKKMVINEHSGKLAFLMDDESVVDCFQCKLNVKNDK